MTARGRSTILLDFHPTRAIYGKVYPAAADSRGYWSPKSERLARHDERAWERTLADAAWIVDALLGTGAIGEPSGTVATAIAAISAVRGRGGVRVGVVGLPSGLACDSGLPAGACVRADLTVTFVAPKLGFEAAEFSGDVHVVSIVAPRAALSRLGT